MKTMRSVQLLVLGAFLVGGLFIVSPVAAQSPLTPACAAAMAPSLSKVSLTPSPVGPITPITGSQVWTWKVHYSAPEQARSLTPIGIELKATPGNANWADVTVSPKTTTLSLEQSGKTEKDITVDITVVLNDKAPAFATQRVQLELIASDGTCVTAPPPFKDEFQIQSGFYQRYNARFDTATFQASQNDKVTIPLTITNLGNGAIEIRPLLDTERTAKKLDVTTPAIVTVGSEIAGMSRFEESVNIEVSTPFKNGYVNERHQLWLTLEGNSADPNRIPLSPLTLNAVIQTQGVYVPGFDVVSVMGAAALGVALLARRRA